MKDKTVVVTGGCGFIGSHIVDQLIKEGAKQIIIIDNLWLYQHGHEVPVFDSPTVTFIIGDAADEYITSTIFRKYEVDIVINCAVMPLPHSINHPVDNFRNNVGVVTNLLERLVENAFGRMVHFSSSEIYGSCQTEPMDETHPIAPSTVYAASKAACDLMVQSYCKMYGVDVAILRPFNNYGPRQNEATYAGVIPRTINRFMAGQTGEIYGSGHQTRDYVYVEDTARAATFLAGQPVEKTTGEVFNFASGRETRIDILINDIREIYMQYSPRGVSPMIQYLPERTGDVERHIGDAGKITSLGFDFRTDIKTGLQKTIKWYMNKNKYATVGGE